MGYSWNDTYTGNPKFSEKKPGDKVVFSPQQTPQALFWDRARQWACNVSRDTVAGQTSAEVPKKYVP
jgi:hypothetical protein